MATVAWYFRLAPGFTGCYKLKPVELPSKQQFCSQWETVMRRVFLKVLVMAQLMSLAALGQSLGDVARESQEKRNADNASGVLAEGDHEQGPFASSGGG